MKQLQAFNINKDFLPRHGLTSHFKWVPGGYGDEYGCVLCGWVSHTMLEGWESIDKHEDRCGKWAHK